MFFFSFFFFFGLDFFAFLLFCHPALEPAFPGMGVAFPHFFFQFLLPSPHCGTLPVLSRPVYGVSPAVGVLCFFFHHLSLCASRNGSGSLFFSEMVHFSFRFVFWHPFSPSRHPPGSPPILSSVFFLRFLSHFPFFVLRNDWRFSSPFVGTRLSSLFSSYNCSLPWVVFFGFLIPLPFDCFPFFFLIVDPSSPLDWSFFEVRAGFAYFAAALFFLNLVTALCLLFRRTSHIKFTFVPQVFLFPIPLVVFLTLPLFMAIFRQFFPIPAFHLFYFFLPGVVAAFSRPVTPPVCPFFFSWLFEVFSALFPYRFGLLFFLQCWFFLFSDFWCLFFFFFSFRFFFLCLVLFPRQHFLSGSLGRGFSVRSFLPPRQFSIF